SEAQIPCLCGDWIEPGRRAGMRAGTRGGFRKREGRRALHFGRGEPYAEADSRQARKDHRAALAKPEVALRLRLCGGSGRRSDLRENIASRASRHRGHGAYGQKENVCQFRQGRARTGVEDRAGRESIAARGRVVPGQWICLESPWWPRWSARCVL